MPYKPDYKAAYETLMCAVDEAARIVERAQIMTSTKISMQKGKDLDPKILEFVKEPNEPSK